MNNTRHAKGMMNAIRSFFVGGSAGGVDNVGGKSRESRLMGEVDRMAGGQQSPRNTTKSKKIKTPRY
jgi:hypothetical protein